MKNIITILMVFLFFLDSTVINSELLTIYSYKDVLRPKAAAKDKTFEKILRYGRLGIEESVVEKWKQILDDEIKRAKLGEGRTHQFSFKVLDELWKSLFHLPRTGDGCFLTTGVSMNMVEKDPKKRQAEFKTQGVPQVVAEAKFLRIKSKRFAKYSGDGLFETEEEAVVPFVGGFYKPDGSEVSEEELAKIGLEWVKDNNGEYIRFPVFATEMLPSRIFFIPLVTQYLRLAVDNERLSILASIRDYEEFISKKFGADNLFELKEKSEKSAKEILTGEFSPESDLYKELKEKVYVTTMRSFLFNSKCLAKLHIVAVRYKGFGAKYVCHTSDSNGKGAEVKLAPNEGLWDKQSEKSKEITGGFVVDNRFEGKSGIILKRYQVTNVAIGASSEVEIAAVQRDRELINKGAELSVINIDAIEIASGEQLKAIGAASGLKPLVGSIGVVVDDTRSLLEILTRWNYYEFLKEEVDPDIEKAKDIHLTNFCEMLAKNIAVCLKCGLTIEYNDVATLPSLGFTRNVSPFGFLRDTGDLVEIKNPYEAMIIIKSAFDGVLRVAKDAGISEKDFIKSKYFDIFVETFFREIDGDDKSNELELYIKRLKTVKDNIPDTDLENKEYSDAIIALAIGLIFIHWCEVLNIKDTEEHLTDFVKTINKNKNLAILLLAIRNQPPLANSEGTQLIAPFINGAKDIRLIEQFYELGFMGAFFKKEAITKDLADMFQKTPEEIFTRAGRIIETMASLPRHYFMGLYKDEAWWRAYCLDTPEPIGNGQTISAESVVFFMTLLLNLNKDDVLLEIGTGSGRQAAIISRFCKEVRTIERIKTLYDFAKENIARFGLDNIHIYYGDGIKGIPDKKAPKEFDKIIITAATDYAQMQNIAEMLKENGLILAPLLEKDKKKQPLILCQKRDNQLVELARFPGFGFVPLAEGRTQGKPMPRRQNLNIDYIIEDVAKDIGSLNDFFVSKGVPPEQRFINADIFVERIKKCGIEIAEAAALRILDELAKAKNPLIERMGEGVYRIIPKGSKSGKAEGLSAQPITYKKEFDISVAVTAAA